ncbi:MAG: methylated-DNA--[protein]-cysteine S-methyltransferase [Ectothiorhodospiraceae bacterium]|nr:methylated-DNA--[protein]-cysteine S-methyltransferase [Ectothiorhodospiraceae bacterium]
MQSLIEARQAMPPTKPPPPGARPARTADVERVRLALEWMAARTDRRPSLADAARTVGLSEFHFQRVFTRHVGLSPSQVWGLLSLERAKAVLDRSRPVLEAALESGLSGPGRLHDLFVRVDALTPGEYRRRGDGLDLRHGIGESPFGPCLLAWTERGLCGLGFIDGEPPDALLTRITRGLARARRIPDPAGAEALARTVFAPGKAPSPSPLRLLVAGTRFQVKVWQALVAVPPGHLVGYGDLARLVGHAGGARAVARAVADNPVAWLVPCHRVIRSTGALGGYRYGAGRKLAMLATEAEASAADADAAVQ